ncbi:siderophore-interacting protein [Nocardia carnea]|uniref:Siderophore-interacting protein n=1 Tax=Nocardia carnea TaxID=37328 RepID=A0ABW7TJP9_9NOCA|nr:siderophore-interacting protein [Nocardia carnea]
MESIKAGIWQRSRGRRLLSLELSVGGIDALTPGFTRVVLEGAALDEYRDPHPADAFKLMLPPARSSAVATPTRSESGLPEWPADTVQPVLRAFTVRGFDPAARRLTMDVARHDHGVGIDWLAAARPGDPVSLSGMRPEWAVGAGICDHVLIGDGTALPALSAILDSLDPDDAVSAYISTPDPADIELVPAHPNLTLHHLADITRILDHTPASIAGGRRTQVWIAAEAAQVRDLRAHAVAVWGIDRSDLLARAYWKRGVTSTENDSVNLIAYRHAATAGADIRDPELAESIDLGADPGDLPVSLVTATAT